MSKRWYSAVHAGGVACVAGALSTGTRKRLDVRTATSGPISYDRRVEKEHALLLLKMVFK